MAVGWQADQEDRRFYLFTRGSHSYNGWIANELVEHQESTTFYATSLHRSQLLITVIVFNDVKQD